MGRAAGLKTNCPATDSYKPRVPRFFLHPENASSEIEAGIDSKSVGFAAESVECLHSFRVVHRPDTTKTIMPIAMNQIGFNTKLIEPLLECALRPRRYKFFESRNNVFTDGNNIADSRDTLRFLEVLMLAERPDSQLA